LKGDGKGMKLSQKGSNATSPASQATFRAGDLISKGFDSGEGGYGFLQSIGTAWDLHNGYGRLAMAANRSMTVMQDAAAVARKFMDKIDSINFNLIALAAPAQ